MAEREGWKEPNERILAGAKIYFFTREGNPYEFLKETLQEFGVEEFTQVEKENPDLQLSPPETVIIDARALEKELSSLVSLIKRVWPGCPVVLIGTHSEKELGAITQKVGAQAFLAMPADQRVLIFTLAGEIHLAAVRRQYFPPGFQKGRRPLPDPPRREPG